MSLADEIRATALKTGFDAVGIADSTRPPRFKDLTHNRLLWLENSWNDRFRPQTLLPGARSVICLAVRQPLSNLCYISRHAVGRDYHLVMKEMLEKLREKIIKMVPGSMCRLCVDSSPIAEKPYAVMAGLGWQGKNSLLILPGKGSYYFLGEIITDIGLESDLPCAKTCGECSLCVDACPTGAIVSPGIIDQVKCIAYQTIENKDTIPLEIRPHIKTIYGCDICQGVCPYNSNRKPVTGNQKFDIVKILYFGEDDFRKKFRDTTLERIGLSRLKRNAAVVIGNCGPPGAAESLTYSIKHGDDLVREHASWAMDKLKKSSK